MRSKILRGARIGSVLLVSLVLLGCASVDRPPVRQDVGALFELDGRMAIRYQEKGYTVSINWRHADVSDDVVLTGPLGQTVAVLSAVPGKVQLNVPEQKFEAPAPESLTERVLGWRLPLAGLVYWVQAKAAPLQPATETRNAQGRLLRLAQAGWDIRYLDYDSDAASALPRRITLTQDAETALEAGVTPVSARNLEIKLIIDQWSPATLAPR